jgi:hypothetical protein
MDKGLNKGTQLNQIQILSLLQNHKDVLLLLKIPMKRRNSNETNFAPAPVTIRNTINQALIQAKAPPSHQVVSVDMNSKGNLVILTNETCMAKDILKYSKQIEAAIKTKDPEVNQIRSSDSWAKVVIHGIDLSIFTDNENGITDLTNEIEKYNPHTILMITPRYMRKLARTVA